MIALNNQLFWKNSKPNSSKSCWPIYLFFEKETKEFSRKMHEILIEKIENFPKSFLAHIDNRSLKINVKIDSHIVILDGQACNYINGNSDTRKCYICLKRGQEFSNQPLDQNCQNEYAVKSNLGIKPLHTTIRTFEKLLQIRYEKNFEVCGKIESKDVKKCLALKNKEILSREKKLIHQKFWDELKIDVDRPRQGFGSTTDGNCAKTAFANYSQTAKILEIDEELIKLLNKFIKLMYSCDTIRMEDFENLASKVKLQRSSCFPSKNLTPTLHLALDHGSSIIEKLHFMPGMFSEEGLEATHKIIRNTMIKFSRNNSRNEKLKDILKRLFFDAYISIE